MDEQVGDMVAGGVEPVKLDIEEPRKERDGLPVVGVQGIRKKVGRKGPAEVLARQAMDEVRVFIDVAGVVNVDELAPPDLPVGRQGQRGQGQAEEVMAFGRNVRVPVSGRD